MSQFPNQQPMGYQPQKPAYQNQTASMSMAAIASLVFGILSLCGLALTGIPAVILGVIAIVLINRSQGRSSGLLMASIGVGLGVLGSLATIPFVLLFTNALAPAISEARDAAQESVQRNNLKQIGIGFHNHHNSKNGMPAAGEIGSSASGIEGSQLSWRVHLLPYLGEHQLYSEFHLDEAWDSPHNLPLLDRMPDVYRNPKETSSSTKTSIVALRLGATAPSNIETMLPPTKQRKFREVTDGLANTILVVSLDPSYGVEWTKPADFDLKWNAPRLGLPEEFSVVLGDGSTLQIGPEIDDATLKALCLINDHTAVHLPY